MILHVPRKKHEMCYHSPEACWLGINSQLKVPYAQLKYHALQLAYRNISNIGRIKFQYLNVSPLVL